MSSLSGKTESRLAPREEQPMSSGLLVAGLDLIVINERTIGEATNRESHSLGKNRMDTFEIEIEINK